MTLQGYSVPELHRFRSRYYCGSGWTPTKLCASTGHRAFVGKVHLVHQQLAAKCPRYAAVWAREGSRGLL